ncbi:hypothetical protein TrLO_g13737 [Triparma laevis f. longispina]|uniref:Mitochondrial splicing suppressor 51-like C-terminal domain-containing protein n=1 Tax=Triparma laevis f. longispina TaxID=1714387 RepID=A0A9W7KYU1_9STRA|nr:hypothetical protein TrLO_g13737 [Triparma laevis f. longispina]
MDDPECYRVGAAQTGWEIMGERIVPFLAWSVDRDTPPESREFGVDELKAFSEDGRSSQPGGAAASDLELLFGYLQRPKEKAEKAKGLLRDREVQQVEMYCLFFYQRLQAGVISMVEMVRMLDLIAEVFGVEARRDVQLGVILRSINGRSAPGPRREIEARGGGGVQLSGSEYGECLKKQYCQLEACQKMEEYDEGVVLMCCEDCERVRYCSEEHCELDEARHKAWCRDLKAERLLSEGLGPYQSSIRLNLTRGLNYADSCFPPHSCFSVMRSSTLSDVEGWEGYFTLRRREMKVEESHFVERLRTESLSSVMTVAESLIGLGWGKGNEEELCVWMLGASHEEYQPWEELFVWFPNLKRVRVILIGPSLTMGGPNSYSKNMGGGREIHLRKLICCLHEVPRTLIDELPKAAAVFALNSGAIFYPEWQPTLKMVIESKMSPLVVTAWLQPEALGVRELLLGLGGRVFKGMGLKENKWASLIPQDSNDDHGSVPFNNRFVMAMV